MCEIRCQFCGIECRSNLSKSCHERFCKLNPDYEHNIKVVAEASRKASKSISNGLKEFYKYNPLNKIEEYKFICQRCGKQYSLMLRKRDFDNGKYSKFCSRACANTRCHSKETKEKIKNSLKKAYEKTLSDETNNDRKQYLLNPKKCKYCGKTIDFSKKKHDFCSRECYKLFCNKKCQGKQKQEKLNKFQKLEKKINEYMENPKHCSACGVELPYAMRYKTACSKECAYLLQSNGGKHSAKIRAKRSKNEIAFANKCIEAFKNCKILTNEPYFNGWDADVILVDYKIAILWNGIWHYKIVRNNQSLKQIQSRDRIKLKMIEKCGYIPYVIKDEGKFSVKKVNEEFEIFKNFLTLHGFSI